MTTTTVNTHDNSYRRRHDQPLSKTSVIARFRSTIPQPSCVDTRVSTPKPPLQEAETPNTSICAQFWGFKPQNSYFIIYILYYITCNLVYQTRQTRGCGCGLGTGDSKSTRTRTQATHTRIPMWVYKPVTGPNAASGEANDDPSIGGCSVGRGTHKTSGRGNGSPTGNAAGSRDADASSPSLYCPTTPHN